MVSPGTYYGHMLVKICIDEGDDDDKKVINIEREHYLALHDLLWVENGLTLGVWWESGRCRQSTLSKLEGICTAILPLGLPAMSLLKCFLNRFVYSPQKTFQTYLFGMHLITALPIMKSLLTLPPPHLIVCTPILSCYPHLQIPSLPVRARRQCPPILPSFKSLHHPSCLLFFLSAGIWPLGNSKITSIFDITSHGTL